MEKLRGVFPQMGPAWTRDAPLPGGEVRDADIVQFMEEFRAAHPWMPRALSHHYVRLYGARATQVVAGATSLAGLGRHFGAQLYEAEARHLHAHEWARTGEDVLWRRTKEVLHMTPEQRRAFDEWFTAHVADSEDRAGARRVDAEATPAPQVSF